MAALEAVPRGHSLCTPTGRRGVLCLLLEHPELVPAHVRTGTGTEGHRGNDGTELETSPNLSPGRETRLPLRVKGEGEGPRLCFSFDQLDIGKVFVGSAHSYEVSWRRLCWVSAQHFCGWEQGRWHHALLKSREPGRVWVLLVGSGRRVLSVKSHSYSW